MYILSEGIKHLFFLLLYIFYNRDILYLFNLLFIYYYLRVSKKVVVENLTNGLKVVNVYE